jgi:hypothetical protein
VLLLLPLFPPTGASHFTAHASGLGSAHGLATLAAAPVLSELQAWSDWDSLYGSRLGPLPAFLAQHQQQLGFRVLEVPGGGLLKLPPAPAGAKLDLQQLRSGLKLAVEQVRGFETSSQIRRWVTAKTQTATQATSGKVKTVQHVTTGIRRLTIGWVLWGMLLLLLLSLPLDWPCTSQPSVHAGVGWWYSRVHGLVMHACSSEGHTRVLHVTLNGEN